MAAVDDELGKHVKQRRDGAGISIDVLYGRVANLLPEEMWGSTEMIRRLETGNLTKRNPLWLAAVAKALGCTLADLSADVAAEYAQFRALVEEVSPADTAKGR